MTRKKNTFGFEEAAYAEGLEAAESQLVARLARVYKDCLPGDKLRRRYYEDKTRASNLGEKLPPKFSKMRVATGWAAKAVDMLAARSILNGIAADGDSAELVSFLADENEIAYLYDMGLTSELMHGCGFLTASPDDEMLMPRGYNGAAVRYHDAESSAAIWDYPRNRVRAGIVIEDVDEVNGLVQPVELTLHTDKHVIVLGYSDGEWAVERKIEHNVGRCLMESMSYRPNTYHPFGKSRISPTVMALIDDMQRATINLAMHDELHASPMKYMLNLSKQQYDEVMSNKAGFSTSSLLATTPANNGQNTSVGMLQASSPEGHIAYADFLARRMASEAKLPVAALAIASTGYTSSDALRASSDDLIEEAEHVNRANGKALRNVMRMACAIARDVPLSQIPDEDRGLTVSFADPAMTTISTTADAWLKICSTPGNEWIGGTSVYLEKLGLSEDERKRLEVEKRVAEARQAIKVFEEGEDDDAL